MQKRLLQILSCFLLLGTLFPLNKTVAQTITDTETVSVSAIVGGLPSVDTGGGVTQSGVRFSGYAYPFAIVTLQKEFNGSATVTADANGAFSILIPELNWKLFTLYATDTSGRRSTLLNFPVVLYTGFLTEIGGIRFAPTISSDKLALRSGDVITVSGAALPLTNVDIRFEGKDQKQFSVLSDADGNYKLSVPLVLQSGEYILRAKYAGDARSSKALRVIVGAGVIKTTDGTENLPGDCNADQKITLIDFSVLAYWYGKENPPQCVDTNSDGVINLVDFSILAFYWSE